MSIISTSSLSKHFPIKNFVGKTEALVKAVDGIDVIIPEGKTFGIVGESGCGKTTVLSCIVGLKSLDDGSISVFGGVPGEASIGIPGNRVGYMPQVRTPLLHIQ